MPTAISISLYTSTNIRTPKLCTTYTNATGKFYLSFTSITILITFGFTCSTVTVTTNIFHKVHTVNVYLTPKKQQMTF